MDGRKGIRFGSCAGHAVVLIVKVNIVDLIM